MLYAQAEEGALDRWAATLSPAELAELQAWLVDVFDHLRPAFLELGKRIGAVMRQAPILPTP